MSPPTISPVQPLTRSPIRALCRILRQWSSDHPEFSFLPRKFKIAVTGSERDRAAIQVHDIGLQLKRNDQGELGFAVWIGGGQGRTPIGQEVGTSCPKPIF
jgi:sulfite reductase (NADPH) hemoprotein beta-component